MPLRDNEGPAPVEGSVPAEDVVQVPPVGSLLEVVSFNLWADPPEIVLRCGSTTLRLYIVSVAFARHHTQGTMKRRMPFTDKDNSEDATAAVASITAIVELKGSDDRQKLRSISMIMGMFTDSMHSRLMGLQPTFIPPTPTDCQGGEIEAPVACKQRPTTRAPTSSSSSSFPGTFPGPPLEPPPTFDDGAGEQLPPPPLPPPTFDNGAGEQLPPSPLPAPSFDDGADEQLPPSPLPPPTFDDGADDLAEPYLPESSSDDAFMHPHPAGATELDRILADDSLNESMIEEE
jgi:hypothetical protein